MEARKIVFCYRKVIDVYSGQLWEKMIFEDSYLEFKMQFQYFNAEHNYKTFAELAQHTAHAERLQFLISPSIMGYIQQLNGVIPDMLNTLGRRFLAFRNFRFELINSDVRDNTVHQIAVSFYSEPVFWHETIGQFLLLSDQPLSDGTIETNLYQIQPFVSIHSIAVL